MLESSAFGPMLLLLTLVVLTALLLLSWPRVASLLHQRCEKQKEDCLAGTALVVCGGAKEDRTKRAQASPHVVVDALNLTHWWQHRTAAPEAHRGKQKGKPAARKQQADKTGLTTCDIVAAIDGTAACLRKVFPGRVMYVTKDRESVFNEPRVRALYQAAANRNKVCIHVVERYVAPPRPTRKRGQSHSQPGPQP